MNQSNVLHHARRVLNRLPPVDYLTRCLLPPGIRHGPRGIKSVGHRRYVGGDWELIGRLQFEFLIERGLEPHHYLLDIGCGNLRGGVHLIRYLEPGRYLGIDKEPELIEQGVREELDQLSYSQRRPQLIVSSNFDFEQFHVQPNFALAQSLFTHLPPSDIRTCLTHLHPAMAEGGVLYATFFETPRRCANPTEPHDHKRFVYTREEMEEMGAEAGWRPHYIGDWNHPRQQMMMGYYPAES